MYLSGHVFEWSMSINFASFYIVSIEFCNIFVFRFFCIDNLIVCQLLRTVLVLGY